MKTVRPQKFKAWETALLLALCVFFLSGTWAENTQRQLAGGLVRLHVIANSDSDADQAAKLAMRDRVLALLTPLLADCQSSEEAVNIILAHQEDIESLGDVSVQLGTEYYPTRDYGSFSLPAGRYVSLRVTMGQGAGHNWWCVVFPPICDAGVIDTDTADAIGLSGKEAKLITADGPGYVVKFRLMEWIGSFLSLFH